MAALEFDSYQTYPDATLEHLQTISATSKDFASPLEAKSFDMQALNQMVKMVQFAATHFSDGASNDQNIPVEQQIVLIRSFAAHCQEMLRLADS